MKTLNNSNVKLVNISKDFRDNDILTYKTFKYSTSELYSFLNRNDIVIFELINKPGYYEVLKKTNTYEKR